MNRFILTAFISLLCIASTAQSAPDDESAVREIANAFAATTLLGSGSNHYVTSVDMLSEDTALAVIGENDGEGSDDPNAYKVTLEKNGEQWGITSYEYIFQPTGKKVIETMDPPFPAPYWDKLMNESG
jgi:hypothetical protein